MMRKLCKGLIVFTLVTFMAGGAFAYDLIDDDLNDDGTARAIGAEEFDGHVTLAPNGKGDVLIYPFYYATEGWESKIQVMNTSQQHSVVAKLVVRSFQHSQEVLDFFIYLTPADVWTGTLTEVNGVIHMQSCDDSTRNNSGEWGNASADPPVCMDKAVVTSNLCSTDHARMGYVEIFEAWHSDDTWVNTRWGAIDPQTGLGMYAYPTFRPNPISKTLLFDWFLNGPVNDDGQFATLTRGEIELQINGFANEIAPANVLAGHIELINETLNVRAPVPATVLEDYNVDTYLTIGTETRFDEFNSTNSLCEVEAALSKDNVSAPYYNMPGQKQTYYWFTFPTKLSNANNTFGCNCAVAGSAESAYFGYSCAATIYAYRYFDLTEQSTSAPNIEFSPPPAAEINRFPDEVNLFKEVGNFVYDEGWVNFNFDHSTLCNPEAWLTAVPPRIRYSGAPVIGTTLFFDFYTNDNCTDCAQSYGISFLPTAYDQSVVEYDRVLAVPVGYEVVDHYQYEDN